MGSASRLGLRPCLLAANGYVRFKNGLTFQWGSKHYAAQYTAEGKVETVVFPTQFTSACYCVQPAVQYGGHITRNDVEWQISSWNIKNFSMVFCHMSGEAADCGYVWWAVGV